MKLEKPKKNSYEYKKSSHVSSQEEKFTEFCKKNGITICKQQMGGDRAGRMYHILFEPDWIDSVERDVVEFCKDKKISFKFERDLEGYHHYEFSEMVNMNEHSADCHINITKLMDRYHSQEVEPKKIKGKFHPPELPWWKKLWHKVNNKARQRYLSYISNLQLEADIKATKEEEERINHQMLVMAGVVSNSCPYRFS